MVKHQFIQKNSEEYWEIRCPYSQTTFWSSIWKTEKIKWGNCPVCQQSVNKEINIFGQQTLQKYGLRVWE